MAPALRFVALVVLCTDDVTGRIGYISRANGNAANVGQKQSLRIKGATHKCVTFLRKTCESTLLQCRALGQEGERKYETKLKMMVMPEFVVPYALHLLAHRKESPSTDVIVTDKSIKASKKGKDSDDESDDVGKSEKENSNLANYVDEQSKHKVLRKRLKWLFEPLVQSLGESADNISFLLRMTEILGKYFVPADVTPLSQTLSDTGKRNSTTPKRRLSLVSNDDSFLSNTAGSSVAKTNYSELSDAKIKTICTVAREVLLSFVKKDVDLTNHPGVIQLPSSLFKRRIIRKIAIKERNDGSNVTKSSSATSSRAKSNSSRDKKRSSTSSAGSGSNSSAARCKRRKISVEQGSISETLRKSQKVMFSPDVVSRHNRRKQRNSSLPTSIEKLTTIEPEVGDDSDFGNLSPIRQLEDSPMSTLGSVKTLGTTPPSILGSELVRSEDVNDENLSMSNSSSARTRRNRDPKLNRISPRKRTRNISSRVRDNEEDEANEVLTSVTQSTGESPEDESYLQTPEGKSRQASPDASKGMSRRSKRSFIQAPSDDASKLTADTDSKGSKKSFPKRSSRSRRIPIQNFSDEDTSKVSEDTESKASKSSVTSRRITRISSAKNGASRTSTDVSEVSVDTSTKNRKKGRRENQATEESSDEENVLAESKSREIAVVQKSIGGKESKNISAKRKRADSSLGGAKKTKIANESEKKTDALKKRSNSRTRSAAGTKISKKKDQISDTSSEESVVSEKDSSVKQTRGRQRTNSRARSMVGSKTSKKKELVLDTSSEGSNAPKKSPAVKKTSGRQRSNSKGNSSAGSKTSKKREPVSDTSSEESVVSEEVPAVKQIRGRQRTNSRYKSGSKTSKIKESVLDTSSKGSNVSEEAPSVKQTRGKQRSISSGRSSVLSKTQKKRDPVPKTSSEERVASKKAPAVKNIKGKQQTNPSTKPVLVSKSPKKRAPVSDTSSEESVVSEEAPVEKQTRGRQRPTSRGRSSKGSKTTQATDPEAIVAAEKAPAAKKTKGNKQSKNTSSKRKRADDGASTTTTITNGAKQKNTRQRQRSNSKARSPTRSIKQKKKKVVSDEFDFDFEETTVRKSLSSHDTNRRLPSVEPKKRARKSNST